MSLCDRSSDPTRARSQRQLPTDHDYAARIREYQGDQPSTQLPRPRPTPLPPRRNKTKTTLRVDRSFHIRDSCRQAIEEQMVGAKGFEPSTSWSRTRCQHLLKSMDSC